MGKFLSGILLSIFAFATVAAQNVESYKTIPVSHWSIGLKAGGNDMDVVPAPATFKNRVHFIVGGTMEYSINPLAGLGVELLNLPYDAEINATTSLKANMIDVVPYFTVNLSNLLFSNREGMWKKVNVFSKIGAGYGFYHFTLNNGPTHYNSTMMVKTGVGAEYTLSKLLALCLEGQYLYFDRGNIGGARKSEGLYQALTGTIGLRIKLGANRKPHACNVSMSEYNPKPIPVDDTKGKEQYEEVLSRLKTAQDQQLELQQKVLELEEVIQNLPTRK